MRTAMDYRNAFLSPKQRAALTVQLLCCGDTLPQLVRLSSLSACPRDALVRTSKSAAGNGPTDAGTGKRSNRTHATAAAVRLLSRTALSVIPDSRGTGTRGCSAHGSANIRLLPVPSPGFSPAGARRRHGNLVVGGTAITQSRQRLSRHEARSTREPTAVDGSTSRDAGIGGTVRAAGGGGRGGRSSVADMRARWLPDLPTFEVPPELLADAAGRPMLPPDDAWANSGVVFCYGKAGLSYADVEQMLERSDLLFTAEDFRNAAEVVWAYRLAPAQAPSHSSWSPEAPGPTASWPQGSRGAAPDATGGSRANGSGHGSASNGLDNAVAEATRRYDIVGFASADLALPPAPCTVDHRAERGGARFATTPGTQPRAQPQHQPPARPPTDPAQGSLHSTATSTPVPSSPTRPTPPSTATATIWHLAVAPGCRRAGLGSALLRRLLARLAERGAARVTLRATSRSAPFYDRLGLVRSPAAPLVKGPLGRAAPLPPGA